MSETCHPTVRLRTPDGEHVDIDAKLVPLIKGLWAAGYETIGCCQNMGESTGRASKRYAVKWKGYVLLEVPVKDAFRLLDAVKNTPQFKNRMHWTDDGAWEVSLPVLPFGLEDEAHIMPWVQFHIPAGQIGDLVDVIGREAAQVF